MIDVLRQRERERKVGRAVSIGYEKDEAPSPTVTDETIERPPTI
jgi:hypothetical protein